MAGDQVRGSWGLGKTAFILSEVDPECRVAHTDHSPWGAGVAAIGVTQRTGCAGEINEGL